MTHAWVRVEAALIANQESLAKGQFPMTDIITILQSISNVQVLTALWSFIKDLYQEGITPGTLQLVDTDVKNRILVGIDVRINICRL